MKFHKEIKIGITVVVAIALLVWGVFFLKGQGLLSSKRTFYAEYKDVSGLVVASPVFVRGVKVGQVGEIIIDVKRDLIVVALTIEQSDLIVPEDTKANFSSADLFTKAISLEIGKSEKLLNDGDTLNSLKQLSLQETVNAQIVPLKEKTQELLSSVDSLVDIFSGLLGRNEGEVDESFRSIKRTILKFENTANNLDLFIAQEKTRVSGILGKVDNIAGTFSANSGKITTTINNLSALSDTLANADISGTIDRAKSTIDQLAQITTKINNGEGTLGALIKSDSLFNALVKTNDEIQRLVVNLKENPQRYVHFSVFGKREKGLKLDARDEKKLKEILDEKK